MASPGKVTVNPFGGIRGTKYGQVFGLVLALLISLAVVLFLGITFCLTPIIAAVVLYFIPTYFGFKSKPKLAVVGLVFLVIIGVSVGVAAASTQDTLTPQTLSLSDYLGNGQVTPFRGSPGSYNFTTELTANIGSNTTPIVQLEILDVWSGADNLYPMTNVNGTNEYYSVQNLGESVYFHAFSYTDTTGTVHTTDWGNGPVIAVTDTIYVHNLELGLVITFYLIGVLFYMLILLTWWMDSSKKKFERQQAERQKNQPKVIPGQAQKEKKEKFVCSECGAEVPADADKCPHCGERFDEEAPAPKQKTLAPPTAKPDEFVCSECGKTVKATDTKCWNCGKDFEN